MRSLLLLGGTGLLFCSCGIIPTAQDFRDIALQVEAVERIAIDNTKDSGDLSVALGDLGTALGAKVEELEERGQGLLKGVSEGAEGGLVGIAAMVALHLFRNGTRKKVLATKKDNGAAA